MSPGRVAGAFVAALLGAGAWHVWTNQAPPAWDDAWYLEISFRLYHALARGLTDFAREWAGAFRIKAPLVSLLPLPLYAVFGPSERVAVWTSLMMHGLSCLLGAAAARSFWAEHPRREAIAALSASLIALIPLLYGLSRLFLVESLLTALVCALVWRLSLGRREPPEGARLGGLLGLGLLAKVSFPLFPAGVALLSRRSWRQHARHALFLAAGLASTWYAFNLPYVLGFAWSAGFGRIGADYAGAGPLAFPGRLAAQALSWPLALVGTGVIAAAAAREQRALLDRGTRLTLAWLAPLAVFAVGANAEPRLTAPALPALALLAARAAMGFRSPVARRAATGALLLAGLAVFYRETLVSAAGERMPWSGRPSRDPGWDRGALVEAAAAAAGPDGVAALALEDRRLNANNLSSLAAARGLGLRFINLGYAQSSAEAALIRLKDRDARALILVEGLSPGDAPAFLNRANEGVAAALASGRLAGRLRAVVPLAPGVAARVYGLVGDGVESTR